MAQCLKCKLDFGEQIPDYCPVCQTICYICPWCGRMTDASQPQCSMLDCGRPIKYLRMTPDLRDIMRLRSRETVTIGHSEVTIDRAIYASQRVTVYKGRVAHTTGKRREGPPRGEVVVVREVMDDYTPRIQEVVSKLQTLKHPNVVRTFVGEADPERCCYQLLQSWVGDRTMASAYLHEEGGAAPSDTELAKIALSLAKGIDYLHSNGIIHCDVTPFNVLLTADGTPVICDFGLATTADDPGKPRGYTPGYAPLELYPSEEIPQGLPGGGWSVGTHTDRYMLGATAYTTACGTDGRSIHHVTRAPVLVPPTDRALYEFGNDGSPQTPIAALKPEIDPALASWVDTLLSLDPQARFKSDLEMVKRIASVSRGIGKRRLIRLPKLGRLKKVAKPVLAAVCLFALVMLFRHSYSIVNGSENLPNLVLADVQASLGLSNGALGTLRSAPRETAEIDYRIGRHLERGGKIEEALAEYKKGLACDANYGPAKAAVNRVRSRLGAASLQRGLQLYRAGEYYLADKQLSLAVHCGYCSTDGYLALSRIAERRGNLARAAGYADLTSKIQPTAVKLHYRAALLYLDSGNLVKAYYHTAKARNLHISPKPNNDISAQDMAELLDEVTNACLRAASLDISKVTSITRIYDKMAWLTRAKNLKPSAEVLAQIGRYYERLGDLSARDRRINYYEQAVTNLQEARKLAPKSPSINNDLARCLNKRQ